MLISGKSRICCIEFLEETLGILPGHLFYRAICTLKIGRIVAHDCRPQGLGDRVFSDGEVGQGNGMDFLFIIIGFGVIAAHHKRTAGYQHQFAVLDVGMDALKRWKWHGERVLWVVSDQRLAFSAQLSEVSFQLSAGSDQRLTFALYILVLWFQNGHLDSVYTIDFLKSHTIFKVHLQNSVTF